MFSLLSTGEFYRGLAALRQAVRNDLGGLFMAAIDDLKQAVTDLAAAVDGEVASLTEIEQKLAAAIAAGNQDPAIAEAAAAVKAVTQKLNDANTGAQSILNPPPAG